MPTSINGWPVIGPDKHYMLATGKIPGVDRKLTTRREVLPFFLALAHDYNKHVTSTVDHGRWDEGGYAYRKSRLNSHWSNHSSGTAIDLDWAHEGAMSADPSFFDKDHPKHHSGIEYMKKKYGDLVNWGGDWHGSNRDAMHWELKKGTTVHDVEKFLRKYDIDKKGVQHKPDDIAGGDAWDGHVPGYDAIIKAQDDGIKNIQAWRLACRLKDLGFFHGDPIKYEQGYPRKAMAAWQEAHGYDVHPDGEYGPKAHKLLFG